MFIVVLLLFHPFCFCDQRIYQITEPVEHAEGPTWDGRKKILYFVDINSGGIYGYNYETGDTKSILVNGPVSPVIPSKHDPDLLIAGIGRSVVALKWDGSKTVGPYHVLTTVSNQFPKSRFNDGKADNKGRLWFGTMGFEDAKGVTPNEGVLYKITEKNLQKPDVMIAPVNISNGLTWNKDNTIFYYIDTPSRKVAQYDYDEQSGAISNPTVAFDLSDFTFLRGFPDGMTIDVDDNLWVALWGGGCVIKINPEGRELLEVIIIPAQYVTSVMWGGPHLDILFVTTSRRPLSQQEIREKQPLAGSVFAVVGIGTKGRPVYSADILKA